MEYEKKFDEIVNDSFFEPTKDFHLLEVIKWIDKGECLLNGSQLDIYVDEESMINHLCETYNITEDEASKAIHYAELNYYSSTKGNNE